MPLTVKPEFKQLNFTTRFEQGYRFLDRCGEAIVRLENTLDDGWITGELSPTGGNMRHPAYGLGIRFNAEAFTIEQTEFIAFDVFRDQASKTLEILWRLFEIKQLRAPVFRVSIHVGFNNDEESEEYIRRLGLVTIDERTLALLGGEQRALSCAIVTEGQAKFAKVEAKFRHRLSVQGIRQAKALDYDDRIMQRVSLLSIRSREAVKGILELRRKHVSAIFYGVELQFEQTLESIFETLNFSLAGFLDARWAKAGDLLKVLPS